MTKKTIIKVLNRKAKILLGVSCSLFIISGIITFIACMFLSPRIYLKEKEITLLVNSELKDREYKAYAMNKDISSQVKVTGEVNTKKVGTYQLTYEVSNFIFVVKKKELVHVVDDTSPTITLKGNKELSLCPNQEYQEEGFTAQDNYDGNLTEKVQVTIDKKEILYKVQDSSKNQAIEKRIIYRKDKTEPILTLKGSGVLTILVGDVYQEKGYQARDNCDGDLTSKVEVIGEVDSSRIGEYLLNYKVKDSSGNEVNATRKIKVVSSLEEATITTGSIYLTFDDGPSSTITPKVLDILKKEKVPATFFVVNWPDQLNFLIRREFQEGHTIALHSYTHDYKTIYQSNFAYLEDLEKIKNKVFQITGQDSKIIRFPGGSSNTISKRYQVGIMSSLAQEVTDKGYHYFDWNVSSEDAGGVNSSQEVYQNVIENLRPNRINVILMHDFENNYYTLNALSDIIQYGKQNGYSFKKITMDTPMITHRIAN